MWHTVVDHAYGTAVQRSARLSEERGSQSEKSTRYHNIEIFMSTTKRSAVNKIVLFKSISWERGKRTILFFFSL